MNTPTRTEFVDTISATTAIKALAEDLRKYAKWEYDNRPDLAGVELQHRHRRDSLLFAADYIEKSL
jgi:hypothetical protein